MSTKHIDLRTRALMLPSTAELLALGGLIARFRVIRDGDRIGIEEAWCDWQGRHFKASSRHGATHALCRELVGAGCPDVAMQVYRDSDGAYQYTFRSIHRAAERTIWESGTRPAASAQFKDRSSDLILHVAGNVAEREVTPEAA
jgi:hypothetical protein